MIPPAEQAHYTVDLEPDAEGWFLARCDCGWLAGPFPAAEDAADALMDHAYEQGRSAAAREAGT